MPARVLRQDPEIREMFRARIREKVEQEKERMRGRIDEEVPSWIRWAVKPLAEWRFDAVRARDRARGDGGEDSAALHFWLLLSGEWILINDAVLEPDPGEFIQVDHVLVGPPGVFLVEAKAWEGAFLAVRDEWRRKAGSSWVRCESPTKQSLRHKRLFVEWLRGLGLGLPGDPDGFVFPIVLLTRCGWLKAEGCSAPIFRDGAHLAGHLRRRTRESRALSPEQREAVAAAVARARPLCAEFGVERVEKVPAKGGDWIRVFGSREGAELARRTYAARGRKVSGVFADRREAGWWCFHVG